MAAITIEGLTKRFGSFTAVSDLNLTVEEKTVFGFLGPNGAGKTTTIRIMVGLMKADIGRISIGGTRVGFGDARGHASFGYLAEQPSFYGWMTGREYLSFAGEIFGLSGADRLDSVKRLLETVGLDQARDKKISSYSGGMKQRLGIAQALINEPDVLILDEPVSALDPMGRKEVLGIIADIGRDKTVFMSTHILADVDRVCNSVGIINEGRLVALAPLARLKEQYASPILQIDFAKDPAPYTSRLEGYDWVKKLQVNGNQMKIWLNDNRVMDDNIPIKALAGFDIAILKYGLTLPETEDLFMEILSKDKEHA